MNNNFRLTVSVIHSFSHRNGMVKTAPGVPRYCRHVGVVHDGLPFLRRTVSYSREEHRSRRE